MTRPRVLILLLLIAGTCTVSADTELQAPDNKGTDFFVAFPQNAAGTPQLTLFLANDGSSDVTVEISSPSFATSYVTGPALSVTTVPLNPAAQVTAVNSVSNKGIRVRSVDPFDSTREGPPIALYAWNRRSFPGPPASVGDGAYVALPTDVLGQVYRAVSRPGSSQITVVGTQDETTVQISTPTGTTIQVVLDALQTYLLQQAADLTGTLVTADKPVAVFSGNQTARVEGSATSLDHMIEEMVPVSAWGDEFVIAPIGPPSIGNSLVRVLAHENGTTVAVNGIPVKTLAAGEVHDFTLAPTSGASVRTYQTVGTIEEFRPALVAQYKKGDALQTDPFLMLIPPVNQFSRQYLFRTPNAFSNQQLNIVVRDGDEGGIVLNNLAVSGWTLVEGPDGSRYKYARVALPANTQQLLEHTEPTVRFGAWVYGHAFAEGFGFAAGQLVNSPPLCNGATASTPLIWPPNHKLVRISINGVVDPNADDLTIEITSIFQDEPPNASEDDGGDGNTMVDGFGIGTSQAQVRAERSGRGNGRVYHIGFTATDPWGARCSGAVAVGVPHDRRRADVAPVDEGLLYDSTVAIYAPPPTGSESGEDEEDEHNDD